MNAVTKLQSWAESYEKGHSPLVSDLYDIIDELFTGWIEGPRDINGDPISYKTKIERWGALEQIWYEMHADGSGEWWVCGHDVTAPRVKARDQKVEHVLEVPEILDELEGMRGNNADYEDVVMRCADLARMLRERLQVW